MSDEQGRAHWAATRKLMGVMLALWALVSFFIHLPVASLNQVVLLGFPLGYWLAAQGSLIIFVALLFWFARRQDASDRAHGFAEDE